MLTLSAFAAASITPAKREYFVVQRDELLQAASSLDLPSGAAKPNEPFLYFHLGPTTLDFFALSIAKGDPKEFAEIADEAITKGLGKELPIKYARERNQIVLDSDDDTSGFFRTNATVTFDLSAVRSVFLAHGLKPKILVRTMSFQDSTGFPSKGKFRKKKLYYDGTSANLVTVFEAITPSILVGIFFSISWLPISLIIGIKQGLKQGRDESQPIEVRRKRYEKMVWRSAILGMGLHLPLFIWLNGTGKLAIVSDLWTGSYGLQSAFGLLMVVSIGAMGLVVKRVDKEEAKLMGYDLKLEAAKKAYRKKITRLGGNVVMALGIIGNCAFLFIITKYREPRFAILALLLPVFIGLLLMPYLEKYSAKKIPFEPPSADAEP